MQFPEAARLAEIEVRLQSAEAEGATYALRHPDCVDIGSIALRIKIRDGEAYLKGEFSLDAARSLPGYAKSALCAQLHAWLSREVRPLDRYEIGDEHADLGLLT